MSNRQRKYASLAVSLALAHASLGAIKYRSVGNGMADIELSLESDQEFNLKMNRLDEAKQYRLKGTWTVYKDNYVLKFKRSKMDMPTLFTSNTGFQKSVMIEDDRTVKIPAAGGGLMIWGIYCTQA